MSTDLPFRVTSILRSYKHTRLSLEVNLLFKKDVFKRYVFFFVNLGYKLSFVRDTINLLCSITNVTKTDRH